MRLRLLFCVLLLTQLATGCATMTASNIGYNRDSFEQYTNVYADGRQITVCYSNYWGREGEASRRWATVDLAAVKWAPFTSALPGMPRETTGLPPPQEFMPHRGPCKPDGGPGLKEVSFYYSADMHTLRHTNPEAEPISLKEIDEGAVHRQDPANIPFTAYGGERYVSNYKRMLVLVRDDPAHSGQQQVAVLASATDLHPVARKASYPLAVALDVITLPFQLIFFLLYDGA